MSHRHRLRWSLLAVACAVGLVATAAFAGHTDAGTAADDAVRGWLLNTVPEVLRQVLDRIARPLVIVVLIPVIGALALLAVARNSWRRAVAGVFVPVASTLLTLELRRRDSFSIGGDAFPSNHAAAGAGLLVGLMVVWPRPVTRRGLVALAVAVVLVGLGNVTWYAHQPRDVVGSAFVVAAVAAGTFALLGGDSPNLRRPPGEKTPAVADPASAP